MAQRGGYDTCICKINKGGNHYPRPLSTLRGDNHEGDGNHGDGDAKDDVVGECFAKDEGAHEDGGDRLKHAEHGGLGGTDITCSDGQCSGRYDSGKQGKTYKVEPVELGGDACQDIGARHADAREEHHGTHTEGVERKQRAGNGADGTATVDDDDEQGIHEGRSDGEHYAKRVDMMSIAALCHDDDTDKRGHDGQPHLPRGDDTQEDHDECHEHRIEENKRGGKARGNVLVGLEEGDTTSRIEEAEHEQYACLAPGDLEALPIAKEHGTEDEYGYAVAEEEDRLHLGTLPHEGHTEKGVKTIADTRDYTCGITYERILA